MNSSNKEEFTDYNGNGIRDTVCCRFSSKDKKLFQNESIFPQKKTLAHTNKMLAFSDLTLPFKERFILCRILPQAAQSLLYFPYEFP